MAVEFEPTTVVDISDVTAINNNFQSIKTALQDALSRSGNIPNSMSADVDMNSNDIINVDNVHASTLVLGGQLVVPSDLVSSSFLALAGTNSPSADIDWGGYKVTNLGDLDQVGLTRLQATSKSFPARMSTIRTSGYSGVGDGGGALYKRVDSEPSHEGKFRSADRFLSTGTTDATNGGWWEIVAKSASSLSLYASPSGTGEGFSSDEPCTLEEAIATAVAYDCPTVINMATGTYTPASGILLDGYVIDFVGVSGATINFSNATSFGLDLRNGTYRADTIIFSGAPNNEAVHVANSDNKKGDTHFTAKDCQFNSSVRGIGVWNGAECFLDGCSADNNSFQGIALFNGSHGVILNTTTNGNTLSGVTYTNQSDGYIANCTMTADGYYGLEVAGSSVVYASNVTVENNVGSRSGFLSSGCSFLQLHTCNATDCDRPYVAEHKGIISGFKVTATSATTKTTYPAFEAFYGGEIHLVATSADRVVVTNYETVFEARDSGLVTMNKPSYVTFTGTTNVANPPVGTKGRNNGLVDMDNISSQSPGREGTYTPTLTATANAGSPTAGGSTYYAQLNETTWKVWGQINTGTRTASTTTQIGISLPVASSLTAQYQLSGHAATTSSGTQQRALIYGDATNDRALFLQDSATVLSGAATWIFEFTYTVV